jgi:hypothetical protein
MAVSLTNESKERERNWDDKQLDVLSAGRKLIYQSAGAADSRSFTLCITLEESFA